MPNFTEKPCHFAYEEQTQLQLQQQQIAAEHAQWLTHPHTKRFISWLEEQHQQIILKAENLETDEKRQLLFLKSSRTIREVLDYARRNNSSTSK